MSGYQDQKRVQQRAMDARLGREQTIWLATTRADGRPHLVPVWFVWHEEKIYICTTAGSQKMVNLQGNRRAAVALPGTADVIIIEGRVNFPGGQVIDELAQQFYDKYSWDFLEDDEGDYRLVEIIPSKVLAWNSNDE